MNKVLAAALSLPLVACVAGAEPAPSSEGGDGSAASGHITASTTWSGVIDVATQVTVDPGITLTVAAGTTIRLAAGTSIVVGGTVDVQGTKDAVVNVSPATSGGHHYGFSIPAGGVLEMSYAVQVGGGFAIDGGKLTVTDTLMSRASGDLLVVGAGTVDMSYSQIGIEPGTGTDTTHCDAHFSGSGITIKITHSNISTSAYGLMLYGGTAVDLTHNNWFANDIDVDTAPGVMGDVSGSWFANGAPVAGGGATLIASSPANKRLTDAGPR